MRHHRDGFTIDTDRARLPIETITCHLRTTYWASARDPEAIRRSRENSAVVFGITSDGDDGQIVGWARVVTDFVTTAYLADVFLLPEHRVHRGGRDARHAAGAARRGPLRPQ